MKAQKPTSDRFETLAPIRVKFIAMRLVHLALVCAAGLGTVLMGCSMAAILVPALAAAPAPAIRAPHTIGALALKAPQQAVSAKC